MILNNLKEKIEKMYLKGLNATQITNRLNYNISSIDEKIKRETVQKHIQRNLSKKKRLHDIKVLENKETEKVINYEANKFMSDKTFIKKNRSIYKTRVNGDIIIDKEVAPCITWDTPTRLTNESRY